MKKRILILVAMLILLVALPPIPLAEETAEAAPVLTTPIHIKSWIVLKASGTGWKWSGLNRTLTLDKDLTIRTTETSIVLPERSTIKTEGNLTILCEEPPKEEPEPLPDGTFPVETRSKEEKVVIPPIALNLGKTGKLILAEGSTLTVNSWGDGVQGGALSFSDCTLNIDAARDGLLTQSLTLGEGTQTTLNCGGVGIRASGDKGVSIDGTATITAVGSGILAPATGRGDRITLAKDSALTIRCEGDGAVGVHVGGGITSAGALSVTSVGAGIRTGTGEGRDFTAEAPLAVHATNGAALTVGGAFLLRDTTATLSSATSDGVVAGGDTTLTAAQLTVSDAGGRGLSTGGALLLDAESALTVTRAGESGVTAVGLVTVDGSLTVAEAMGNGLTSTEAGLILSGDATIHAAGDGIRCALGITCGETGLLTVTAGGDGVVSKTGAVTLAVRPEGESRITAEGIGIRSGDKVTLCQPGVLTIAAGTLGVRAVGDVSVGGAAEARCDLTITCQENSIWSENGNVTLRACNGCYFFDESIRVNSALGKTLSVLEGAGLIFGMRGGFAVGIVRKDYTILPAVTPQLLSLRTLQIGQGHTVTVAPGAQVKVGPLIMGRNARLVCPTGSKVYYNGPVQQVQGQVQPYTTTPLDLTVANPRLNKQAGWDGETLTLRDAVLDVPDGPAVILPPGSTLRLEGYTNLAVGSGESVVACGGDLTVVGGALTLSGGNTGIQASGDLRLEDTSVNVRGAKVAAISAGAITTTRSAVEVYGDGVALRATGEISIDSLPPEVTSAQQNGWSVLLQDGKVVAQLSLAGDGPPVSRVVTQTQTGADGARIETATDQDTGIVTVTTAATNGAVTLRQTRPDGVESLVTVAPDGTREAQVTLPAGMEKTVVSLPVPGATSQTVPLLRKEGGVDTPLALSQSADGAVKLRLEGSAKLLLSDAEVAFADVAESNWCYPSVTFLAGRDLFRGIGDGKFDPTGTTTCGMMAAVLHRLCGEPKTTIDSNHPLQKDIPADAYYAQGVAWALEKGIVDGETDGFLPLEHISRQQLAVMLYRCADQLGLDSRPRAALDRFDDSASAAPWAAEGLRWAVAQGVLPGRGNGLLDPAGTATRAEVSAMLARYAALTLRPAE